MEKFNANNLYYGVVEVRNKRIFETYKSILLKLNNKLYFDFKNEIISLISDKKTFDQRYIKVNNL